MGIGLSVGKQIYLHSKSTLGFFLEYLNHLIIFQGHILPAVVVMLRVREAQFLGEDLFKCQVPLKYF